VVRRPCRSSRGAYAARGSTMQAFARRACAALPIHLSRRHLPNQETLDPTLSFAQRPLVRRLLNAQAAAATRRNRMNRSRSTVCIAFASIALYGSVTGCDQDSEPLDTEVDPDELEPTSVGQVCSRELTPHARTVIESTPVAFLDGPAPVLNAPVLATTLADGTPITYAEVHVVDRPEGIQFYYERRFQRPDGLRVTRYQPLVAVGNALFLETSTHKAPSHDCESPEWACTTCELSVSGSGASFCVCPGNDSGDCSIADTCPTEDELMDNFR
jgi:hypothetical protein